MKAVADNGFAEIALSDQAPRLEFAGTMASASRTSRKLISNLPTTNTRMTELYRPFEGSHRRRLHLAACALPPHGLGIGAHAC